MEKKKTQTYTGRRSVKESPADSDVMIANTMTMAKKNSVFIVGQKIKERRDQLGIEQKAFAAQIGVGANAVSNWEHGRARPDISLLPKICALLQIPIHELFDLPAPNEPQLSKEAQKLQQLQDEHGEDARRVLDKFFRLSPGHQYAVESLMDTLDEAEDAEICKHIIEKIEFSKALAAGFDPGEEFDDKGEKIYLYRTTENEQGDCVFTVSGDSMEPEFHNGDKVLVKRFPNCQPLEPGDVGAFITGNETYIKEYRKDGLHSYNKRYKTMKFTEDDSVYIIGKVLKRLTPSDIVSFEDTMRYQRIVEKKGKD